MAKKAAKETSTPLVFALVFFVLTTIAFGVMWYMGMADLQTAKEAADKAKKDVAAANGLAKEADLKSKLYAVYLGVSEPEDLASLMAEHKAGDKLSAELKRVNEAMAKKLSVADAAALPPALQTWMVDAGGQIPKDGPSEGIIQAVGKAQKDRDDAMGKEAATSKLYADAANKLTDATKALAGIQKIFEEKAGSLPKDFETKLKTEIDKYEGRVKQFVAAEAKSREEIEAGIQQQGALEREKKKMELQIAKLTDELGIAVAQVAKAQNNSFSYDEPQGKILRRPEPDIVEINIGSNDHVRPGLTFTVLPYDFQEKGRQSRMKMMRIPDERGRYKNVERFVEKATIEVIEVLGPNLSRARVTQEYDPIRDGAAVGDLLYNSVWRKGYADHIALIGIFDVNGDGSDDLESVIRDLNRMGIPVDAYFDMKTRKWVGQLTEQTRFIVEGWYPVNSANDPNREDKTKLLGDMNAAIKQGKEKGINAVKFQDFFPRMGYRVKLDVSPDKLNQATAPYLNRVGTSDAPAVPPGN
jgi:hypothetical protein